MFCMSGKPLSKGTYMPNMKALSERIQNLWPMLKLSNKQTNKQTEQKQYVPAVATGHKKVSEANNFLLKRLSNKPKMF